MNNKSTRLLRKNTVSEIKKHHYVIHSRGGLRFHYWSDTDRFHKNQGDGNCTAAEKAWVIHEVALQQIVQP